MGMVSVAVKPNSTCEDRSLIKGFSSNIPISLRVLVALGTLQAAAFVLAVGSWKHSNPCFLDLFIWEEHSMANCFFKGQ